METLHGSGLMMHKDLKASNIFVNRIDKTGNSDYKFVDLKCQIEERFGLSLFLGFSPRLLELNWQRGHRALEATKLYIQPIVSSRKC